MRHIDGLAIALVLASFASASATPAVAGPRPQSGSCATPGRCYVALPRSGRPPLSDHAAAQLVQRSPWEPRPGNTAANQHVPTRSDLAYFRAHDKMPYKGQVTGAFTGTTDEIIQWAAHKHGLDPNLLRAVAAVESWWRMSAIGDKGDSFGLFQIRRPYHCCAFLAAHDSAFNADYYGAIIRAYYDGRQTWINNLSGNGARYRAGDLWGSVGAWVSGRWHDRRADRYIAKVKRYLRERVWRQPDF